MGVLVVCRTKHTIRHDTISSEWKDYSFADTIPFQLLKYSTDTSVNSRIQYDTTEYTVNPRKSTRWMGILKWKATKVLAEDLANFISRETPDKLLRVGVEFIRPNNGQLFGHA